MVLGVFRPVSNASAVPGIGRGRALQVDGSSSSMSVASGLELQRLSAPRGAAPDARLGEAGNDGMRISAGRPGRPGPMVLTSGLYQIGAPWTRPIRASGRHDPTSRICQRCFRRLANDLETREPADAGLEEPVPLPSDGRSHGNAGSVVGDQEDGNGRMTFSSTDAIHPSLSPT